MTSQSGNQTNQTNMSPYGVVLVPMAGLKPSERALQAGLGVARLFGGKLDVVCAAIDPAATVTYLGEGSTGAVIEDLIEAAARENRQRETAVRELAKKVLGSDDAVRIEVGRDVDVVASIGRFADIVVLEQPGEKSDPSFEIAVETVLLDSGRPALVVPEQQPVSAALEEGCTAVIAWRDTMEGARAVSAALPFLKRAGMVQILSGEGAQLDGLLAYLAAHGITTEQYAMGTERGFMLDDHTGDEILDHCRRVGADLLVMGAYVHGTIRRIILGGPTRTVLSRAEIPVLMSH